MILLHKILSISVFSVICASNIFAQSGSILCELPESTIQAQYDKANKMQYNAVEPTLHFIVIDGKGYGVNKKQYYYHFLEVGTESNMNGTNENNRLYIYNTEIKGTRGFDTREYILTEVRKHGLSGDACP